MSVKSSKLDFKIDRMRVAKTQEEPFGLFVMSSFFNTQSTS